MIDRKLIASMPVLLVMGILAQVVLLALVVVLFVPLLIWPRMLDRPYRWVTRGFARIIAKGMMGHKRREVTAA